MALNKNMKRKLNYVYQSEATDGLEFNGGGSDTNGGEDGQNESLESQGGEVDKEKELLRRSLANTKKDKEDLRRKLENLSEVEKLLASNNLSLEEIREAQAKQKAFAEQQRQQQQIEEEAARRLAQKDAQHKAELDEIKISSNKRANELQLELERKEKFDAFAEYYWKYGGIAAEPHPITGKTKIKQLFDDIESNFKKGEEGLTYEAIDFRGQRVPTKDGSGFKDLDNLIADLATSPQYADFFNSLARNPVGGGYGMSPVGRGQNFPVGAGVVSQKDFQSGKVDYAAVAEGRVKVRS
jgi:hypothetical protein